MPTTDINNLLSNNQSNRPHGNHNAAANPAPLHNLPQVNLPTGGGAIRGIEEKFNVNAINGTSSFGIPIPFTSARNGFTPSLGLNYNSGGGNSEFGLGWDIGIQSISRKTERRLPQYKDDEESDVFILSGSEELVPLLEMVGGAWQRYVKPRTVNTVAYTVKRYKPRIEALFAIIEQWENNVTGETFWQTIGSNNVCSWYGLTADSRISDPADDKKVFSWLLCKTYNDKGSICLYKYRKENFVNIPKKLYEKNRINNCTQTYLKKVLYGNRTPFYAGNADPAESNFLFQVVLDYGEHDTAAAIPRNIDAEVNTWPCRKDPFSIYRAGFEIRTYRRCSRILMFHCFDSPDLPHKPYLVKSLQLFYDEDMDMLSSGKQSDGFSYLVKAKHNGHKWDAASNTYTTKSLPEMELVYQQHEWNTTIKTPSADDIANAPTGIDDLQYLWIDLFSEGISGILTEQGGGWYYKSNLGNGHFSNALPVAPKPSFNGLAERAVIITELEGNGVKYLVKQGTEPQGFYRLTEDDEWQPFTGFQSMPNIDFQRRNVRTLDLTGDGIADMLVADENVFRWYKGLGEKGFELSASIAKEIDEEKGPAIVFEDITQSIFLADMNGDGLTDILRIRNGEICYWPNLGYGRFGSKVSMDNSPVFDHPDLFNPAFLRLSDIDGSGTTDVVYLGKNDFRVWMNKNGNEWSTEPQVIPSFPAIDNLADVAVLDFLGTGTSCIVYSSPLAAQPLQYIDLMGSKKPHMLYRFLNNCGKEVSIEYKSSTQYYLDDKKQGRKWITKLPFPVTCISSVRSEDKIRKTVFTTSYKYSHGYYDIPEKEFRGFARVEQLDTEDYQHFKLNDAKNVVQEDLHQPPVRKITWFHTGAYVRNATILHQCRSEYFKNTLFQEYKLPEPIIKDDLSAGEMREAMRALKGMVLRSETYANDNLPQSTLPYTAFESNCEIRRVQVKAAGNQSACFIIIPSEGISYFYERNPADPRITHTFMLQADELGNVERSASVIYPRVQRPSGADAIPNQVWNEQNKLYIAYSETTYTDDIITPDAYRLRVNCGAKGYELAGIAQPAGFFFKLETLAADIAAAGEILYDQDFTAGKQKRLTSDSRIYFLKDDLSGPLPFRKISVLGFGHKSYQLAFTKNLVTKYYGTKVTDAMLIAAKYVHVDGDDHWWVQSGEPIFPALPQNKFYMPVGARDVFGNESNVVFDQYNTLVTSATDAIGNTVIALNDYRTMGLLMATDPNQNRTAVETDELGLVIKTAFMGKAGAGEGDTLADPTARMEYDLFNWKLNGKPNYVRTLSREKHGAANPRWQENYSYSDGSGNIVMIKGQVKPGKARRWNTVTKTVDEVDADPRWLANGRTVVNNKGNAVKQYEPYFSTTHEYESEDALVETGMSPISYFDAAGRNYLIKYPDGTFSKTTFNAWYSKAYDTNDTVKDSDWYVQRGSPDPLVAPEPANPAQRAAWLAAKHHNTPATIHTDSLGRAFYAITDYGNGKTTFVFTESDMVGRYAKTYDQLQRKITEGYTNLIGATIYGKSAEKGEQWIFSDVMGRLVKMWDNNIREFRTTYDTLNRAVSTFMKEGATEIMFGHIVYGDILTDAVQKNMKGGIYQMYDQAGCVTVQSLDFKGNPITARRKFCKEYKQSVNWQILAGLNTVAAIDAAAAPLLETETFSSSAIVDALNRPVQVTLPDNSVLQPVYNLSNTLESLTVQVRGQGAFINFLQNQEFDVRGRRQSVRYGNGLITNYFYDPKSFRLTRLITKPLGAPDSQSQQDISYEHDSIGNIVYAKDNAQQTYYFQNAVVGAETKYEYDAIYRLTKASGREHGALGNNAPTNIDFPALGSLPHLNNSSAVRNYTENYQYDDCGNLLQIQHIATTANWTQHFRYQYQDNPANNTNRLQSTERPGDPAGGPYTNLYTYDTHGNMTSMPHLSSMVWDFSDQLHEVDLGGGGKAYYVYGTGGNRVRKIIERPGGKRVERLYLGSVEIYREYNANAKKLERSTLHISDGAGKIAQVDTKVQDTNNADPSNAVNQNLIRYQYGNHLGSATVETDENGVIISYEEYHPFGTTSLRSSKSTSDLSLKRYRFTGAERDEESGLYHMGSRYYAAWLGRWTSSDPAGFVDGANLYAYCRNHPVNFTDPTGTERTYVDIPEHLRGVTDPAEFSRGMRAMGYNFTGFGPDGTEMAPDATGRGVGLARRTSTGGWDVGTWLNDMPPPSDEPADGGPAGSPEAAHDEAPAPGGGGPSGEAPGPNAGLGGIISEGGRGAVLTNPEGFTLPLANGTDAEQLDAYRSGVRERTIGSRSGGTRAIRSAGRPARRAFINANQPQPPGSQAGHLVDLQHDLRPNAGMSPDDFRWEPGAGPGANMSRGATNRGLRTGLPQGVPAGAAVEASEVGRFYNRPGFRTAMRGGGYILMAAGPAFTFWGSSQIENTGVRYTGYGFGAVETVGVGLYGYGRIFMGGGAQGAPAGLRVMGLGTGVMRYAGGGAAIVLSTYSLINNYQNENYGVMLGDTAGIVAGGAMLVGSGPVAAAAGGVAVTNMLGDVVERNVTPSCGRTVGVGAGVAAGAAAGAAIGAAVGVWGFGVAAIPAAAVGAVIGGIAGFVGAYW